MTNHQSNLSQQLLDQYGPMVSGRDLYTALGFKSYGAFRLANEKKQIPINVFKIANRRDWHALTGDLAAWLTSLPKNKCDQFKEAAN